MKDNQETLKKNGKNDKKGKTSVRRVFVAALAIATAGLASDSMVNAGNGENPPPSTSTSVNETPTPTSVDPSETIVTTIVPTDGSTDTPGSSQQPIFEGDLICLDGKGQPVSVTLGTCAPEGVDGHPSNDGATGVSGPTKPTIPETL